MICDHSVRIDIRELAKLVDAIPDVVPFEGERIATEWTTTPFGGRRQWFLCPSCDRRCAILYRRGAGPLWGCRVCMNGRHLSEHMSPQDRRYHKAFKIRKRLGQTSGGIAVPFPEKPKGMHWKTYHRIRAAALRLENEIMRHTLKGSKFERYLEVIDTDTS